MCVSRKCSSFCTISVVIAHWEHHMHRRTKTIVMTSTMSHHSVLTQTTAFFPIVFVGFCWIEWRKKNTKQKCAQTMKWTQHMKSVLILSVWRLSFLIVLCQLKKQRWIMTRTMRPHSIETRRGNQNTHLAQLVFLRTTVATVSAHIEPST